MTDIVDKATRSRMMAGIRNRASFPNKLYEDVAMTELLEKAFSEISKLPEPQQDSFARWLLDEIASEQRWNKAFSESQDLLSQLAREALAEHRSSKTERLNPDLAA
jgi:hypothetical protein